MDAYKEAIETLKQVFGVYVITSTNLATGEKHYDLSVEDEEIPEPRPTMEKKITAEQARILKKVGF